MSALPPEWQTFFAVAGFILSVILATIKGYEFCLDRTRVRVRVDTLGMCWDPKVGNFAGLHVEIVNAGRRVAYVTEIAVRLKPENSHGLQSEWGYLNFDIGKEGFQLLDGSERRSIFIFR